MVEILVECGEDIKGVIYSTAFFNLKGDYHHHNNIHIYDTATLSMPTNFSFKRIVAKFH